VVKQTPVQLLRPSEHTLVGVHVIELGQSDLVMSQGMVNCGGGGVVMEEGGGVVRDRDGGRYAIAIGRSTKKVAEIILNESHERLNRLLILLR
jgi:hypothetical protein